MQAAELDVLIVDDHEGMRTLLARVLTKAGVNRVRAAATSVEALSMLGERAANLILADKSMPGMDGLAFIEKVRASADFGASKIIMISGHGGAQHEQAARASGADLLLVKPVSPRDLLAAIESLFAF